MARSESKKDVIASTVLFLLTSLLTLINPWLVIQMIRQVLGQSHAALRGFHSGPQQIGVAAYAEHEAFHPPFEGPWEVVRGGATREHSHSWHVLAQRYAYDFVAVNSSGEEAYSTKRNLKKWYAYGRPILSPADGVVTEVKSDCRDFPLAGTGAVDFLAKDIRGNYLIIDHGSRRYSLIAHMQKGSCFLKPGDHIRRGQIIGRCGNSGMSTQPHIHFQLQDHPDFFLALGVPIVFVPLRVSRHTVDCMRQEVMTVQPLEGDTVVDSQVNDIVEEINVSPIMCPGLQDVAVSIALAFLTLAGIFLLWFRIIAAFSATS